ncbi:type 1 glutamine amidotransferase domain-containing protein [Actinocorallia sp. API 0066]|uniref:type 1 glutamine amidotransferase domain-containing protein n=1 Tax=Actinocorallia sp. API 0066 TaxID=2896846 RepID=UPI001E48362F|nr:type 1 glutamine amidotransferase domain-containing protein [Actinocorallia sp. API 0066]MCD0449085.1 type 1 glutamine amidotransferase domain-containing protein [Actinocorallia sp. API 0066]
MSKVLFVVTGATYWTLNDGTRHPTGYWAEELLTPYRALTGAGHEVEFATPGGVTPVVDQGSLAPDANGGEDVAPELAGIAGLESPLKLDEVDLADYDAVFYPGGHGPMEDLAVDATSGRLLVAALNSGKPLAVVCHAPAALLAATLEDGTSAFRGRRITAFSNEEERQAGLADRAVWLLEDRLREIGADVSVAAPWTPNVVVDGTLVTGQNPMSSALIADELLKRLA